MARTGTYPIQDIFLQRWSSRAFSDESVTDEELMTMFEAARWAQNSYNNQPWRFMYARRTVPMWDVFFNFLVPANREWVQHAQLLIVVTSQMFFSANGKPSRTHSFDTGAACQNMSLQAASMDIVAHGMEGFDYDAVRRELHIPETYAVEAMFAVGKRGDRSSLSPKLQERETPSQRKPLEDMVCVCIDTVHFPW
jgi:nitroreductase